MHAKTRYATMYPNDPQPFLTCSYRSNEEQAELYAQGRTKPGKIVTKLSKNGKHNVRPSKAFDIAFKDSKNKLHWDDEFFTKFAKFVAEFDSSIVWGGTWKRLKDLPHFQV